MSGARFAVCVPARNERDLLPKLLTSLTTQTAGWDYGRIFLVANNCTDDTVAVATRWKSRLPLTIIDVAFSATEAHAGTARKLALDAGADWLGETHKDALLLTTDADAIVPDDWVASNIRALVHSDIVGGRLDADLEGATDATTRLRGQIERYWTGVRGIEETIDPQNHDPAPRHGDHTGGSLAFRASLYRRLGGLTPLPSGEDVDFVKRALHSGAKTSSLPPRVGPSVGADRRARVGRNGAGHGAPTCGRLGRTDVPIAFACVLDRPRRGATSAPAGMARRCRLQTRAAG